MIVNLPRKKKAASYPVKGDLIELDLDGLRERSYRVLKINGSVAQVMAMYDSLESAWDSNYPTAEIGDVEVAKYEGSEIDTYLNTTWYEGLKDSVKNAIVPESVVCDVWCDGDADGPDYTGTCGPAVPGTLSYTVGKYTDDTLNIGERNVFALSVQDVINYLNDPSVQVDTTAILRNVNIWKMFWDKETQPTKYTSLWLRSSHAEDSDNAYCVTGVYGDLSDNPVPDYNVVRPVLNLDLSQIPYTQK